MLLYHDTCCIMLLLLLMFSCCCIMLLFACCCIMLFVFLLLFHAVVCLLLFACCCIMLFVFLLFYHAVVSYHTHTVADILPLLSSVAEWTSPSSMSRTAVKPCWGARGHASGYWCVRCTSTVASWTSSRRYLSHLW
jgi:hypothetical protein